MVFSFKNVQASIQGPGGFANFGDGGAPSEEGITIEAVEDKNVMTMGADGKGQHSLVASNAAKVTIRLLKTSPINAILMLMYNIQSASSSLWGQNVITIADTGRGDLTLITEAAFNKIPALTYAKEAGMNEWILDAVSRTTVLGTGN